MPFPVEHIDAACKANGITIAELERKLHIGNGVIRRWKTQKAAPPVDRLVAISETLHVTMDYLMSGHEKRPAEAGQRDELIRLYEAASPELQAAALAVLRSAEASPSTQGVDPAK